MLVLVCVLGRAVSGADSAMPVLPVNVDIVCSNVSANTIHGWQSNRLLKFEGVLYATAGVLRPNEGRGDMMGSDKKSLIFRREPDGQWLQVAALNERSYSWCVAPDGTFWIVAPTSYYDTRTLRTRVPRDFSSFEPVYTDGKCCYFGASTSSEGNFLLLHAEKEDANDFMAANAVISVFYDCATGKWHKSRTETPEGRFAYEGILLQGNAALAILNSAIRRPEGGSSIWNWRHVRLARCDDLTQGKWVNQAWLMPKYGHTVLQDMIRGPDGCVYLAYSHSASDVSWEEADKAPLRHYIARIHDDLTVDVFPTGLATPSKATWSLSTRIFVDSTKNWYLLGRPAPNKNLHLWKLNPDAGFKPVTEYELPGTDVLEGYVIHTLRPERFGGESDGNKVHLLTTRHIYGADKKTIDHAELWHASFDLPAGR
jgi:hypothetical protein